MSETFYYHELSDQHFDTYEECQEDLWTYLDKGALRDWIEEHYSNTQLANLLLILFKQPSKQRDIILEFFINSLYEAIEEDWIFYGQEEEEIDFGICDSCYHERWCSRKDETLRECPKYAFMSNYKHDPFKEK